MTAKAQREYYSMPPAAKVLEDRVAALSEAIPRGSVILDIGCNDGSISHRLVEAGVVSKSYGFDLEDILAHRRPELVFRAANLKELDLATLPDADGVIILNLLHHLVGSSKDRAKHVIDYLIERYGFVIIDMGSFTENGDWYWRRAYNKYWQSDAQMWDFLFDKAELRFKLLRYPTQGKGFRTLWKLYRKRYEIGDLETIETFKRPPGAWPERKQLIPLTEVGESEVVNSVDFQLARSAKGDKFWVKRYTAHTRAIRAELEMRLATHAAAEIAYLNSKTHCDLRASVPLSVEADGVLRFVFEPDVFSGTIVHFHDWPKFFTPEECRAAGVLGTRPLVAIEGLPRLMLIHACDYQICSTWDGLTALDFEPNNWLVKLTDLNSLTLPSKPRRAKAAPPPSPRVEAGLPPELATTLQEIRSDLQGLRKAVSKLRRALDKEHDASSAQA